MLCGQIGEVGARGYLPLKVFTLLFAVDQDVAGRSQGHGFAPREDVACQESRSTIIPGVHFLPRVFR